MSKGKKNNKRKIIIAIVLILLVIAAAILIWQSGILDELFAPVLQEEQIPSPEEDSGVITLKNIPDYTGDAYIALYNNEPNFAEDEITSEAYEFFSELDELGRCGMTEACVGQELMPTEDRESISHVKPSGWVNVPYDFVDGRYLYNRCHLIGFQLTGENANERNLITGTRYMNVDGMLPFENMVADYVKETNNHVMYRVTPIYDEDDLVAKGVQLEAWSVEDKGEGVCFNVYVYNVQPGVEIDYATGESWLAEGGAPAADNDEKDKSDSSEKKTFVINTSSKKFHLPECSGATGMDEKNREEYKGTSKELTDKGYKPCGQCKP